MAAARVASMAAVGSMLPTARILASMAVAIHASIPAVESMLPTAARMGSIPTVRAMALTVAIRAVLAEARMA